MAAAHHLFADDALAIDDLGRLAGADAEHDDAEEIAEIIPAAVVGDGVNGNVALEQRDDPGDREDEAVPQAFEEAGGGGIYRGRRLLGAGGEGDRGGKQAEAACYQNNLPPRTVLPASTRAIRPRHIWMYM